MQEPYFADADCECQSIPMHVASKVPGDDVVPTFGFLHAAPQEAAAELVDTVVEP